jgi:hypothetical protein
VSQKRRTTTLVLIIILLLLFGGGGGYYGYNRYGPAGGIVPIMSSWWLSGSCSVAADYDDVIAASLK